MARPRKERPKWDELATIWQVSDELWAVIVPILADLVAEADGQAPRRRAGDPRCDHLPAAERLPVEPVPRAFP